MPKVYVTQESGFDYSSAEKYGELVFVTLEDLYTGDARSIHNEKTLSVMATKLNEFNPDEDWIVISGSPYVAAVACLLIGFLHPNQVKILRWDNREYCYRPLVVNLRGRMIPDFVKA